MLSTLRKYARYFALLRWVRGVVQSATTRHVFFASGSLVALFHIVRGLWPMALPWPEEHDAVIEGALLSVLTPLLSRVVAFALKPESFRNPETLLRDVSPDARGD